MNHKTKLWSTLSMAGVGAAIALSGFTVVRAEHAPPPKGKTSFTCSSGTACLQAKSSGASTPAFIGAATVGTANAITATAASGDAVYGSSSSGYGVVGGSGGAAGIFGESTGAASGSTGFPGVYGYGEYGSGVYGVGGVGQYAGYPGVYGYSPYYAYGVYAYAPSGIGAAGYGDYGGGIFTASGSGAVALEAQGTDATTDLFQANNSSTGKGCYIDYNGNLTCTGSITGGALEARRHHTSNGRRVLAYASESSSATIEDFGHGRLFDGVADIQMSPDFASIIDRSDYYVFLTPLGEGSLYVSMKTANGFQVRELGRARASFAFDYRIVARPLDADGQRLPAAPHIKFAHRPALNFPPPPLPKMTR